MEMQTPVGLSVASTDLMPNKDKQADVTTANVFPLPRYILWFLSLLINRISVDKTCKNCQDLKNNYRIQPNYRTCSYKRTVKQLSIL